MSVTLTFTEQSLEEVNGQDRTVDESNGLDDEDVREAELVIFENTTQGLGLKVFGGCSADGKEDFGIFVKNILPGGLAEQGGGIHQGDLILEVNGQSMQGITHERAVSMLRQASATNHVELIVARDTEARAEYEEYVKRFKSNLGLMSDQFHGKHHSDNLNGHVSPLSSCASEVANHMREQPSLANNYRPSSNGSSQAPLSPTDELDSLFSNKLSRDSGHRLHIDQLEKAIHSLGLDFPVTTQQALRENLTIDDDGFVSYDDFVHIAKMFFRKDLIAMKSRQIAHPTDDQIEDDEASGTHPVSVVRERDSLRLEVAALKEELRRRGESSQNTEEQLLFMRKQMQASKEEAQCLKSKVRLVEKALENAQQIEKDYEEVVAMLENEVAQLQLQVSKSEGVNMQKRLAVLVCQLKKAESSKKTYEVATEKLMNHVQHSVEILSSFENSPRHARGAEGGNAKAASKKAASNLCQESREMIGTVRSLMETVPLPFGWEEAYTSEGARYYINHLNQTTTWTHPVSCMEHTNVKSGTGSKEQEPSASFSSQPRPPPVTQSAATAQQASSSSSQQPKPPQLASHSQEQGGQEESSMGQQHKSRISPLPLGLRRQAAS